MFPRMSHSIIASSSKDGANMCQFDARASMNCSNSGGKPSLLRADDCWCVSRTVPFQATDSFLMFSEPQNHRNPSSLPLSSPWCLTKCPLAPAASTPGSQHTHEARQPQLQRLLPDRVARRHKQKNTEWNYEEVFQTSKMIPCSTWQLK